MLRILVADSLHDDTAVEWVRYGRDGRTIGRGRDVRSRWPSDGEIEIVLAAASTRLVALSLPPMPRARVTQAVRYAVEDQMASTMEESALAIHDAGGRILVAIASKALIDALAPRGVRVSAIVPECALAPFGGGWRWYASAGGGGFIRRDDGSAFAVEGARDTIPNELSAALAAARASDAAPRTVHVSLGVDPARLEAWTREMGVPFTPASAWRWSDANAEAFRTAPNFIALEAPSAPRPAMRSAFRPALVIAGLALGVQLVALLFDWGALTVADWRASRALIEEARLAGLANVTDAESAAAAIARQNADLRHRAGKPASTDALPLLARAAPALASGAMRGVKSMAYRGGTWTLELSTTDAASITELSRSLDQAGLRTIAAPVAGGTRMRVTLDPAYQ
jgi:hypothetical protein